MVKHLAGCVSLVVLAGCYCPNSIEKAQIPLSVGELKKVANEHDEAIRPMVVSSLPVEAGNDELTVRSLPTGIRNRLPVIEKALGSEARRDAEREAFRACWKVLADSAKDYRRHAEAIDVNLLSMYLMAGMGEGLATFQPQAEAMLRDSVFPIIELNETLFVFAETGFHPDLPREDMVWLTPEHMAVANGVLKDRLRSAQYRLDLLCLRFSNMMQDASAATHCDNELFDAITDVRSHFMGGRLVVKTETIDWSNRDVDWRTKRPRVSFADDAPVSLLLMDEAEFSQEFGNLIYMPPGSVVIQETAGSD